MTSGAIHEPADGDLLRFDSYFDVISGELQQCLAHWCLIDYFMRAGFAYRLKRVLLHLCEKRPVIRLLTVKKL